MKALRILLLFSLLVSWASAQEYVLSIRGPLEMTDGVRTIKIQDEFDAVLLSSGQGSVSLRPLLFVRKAQIDKQGRVLTDHADLLVGPFPLETQPVAAVASKGEQLQILRRDYGDWVLAYSPTLPAFQTKNPRWFHRPGKVTWTKRFPGVAARTIDKIRAARTSAGRTFPFVLLPRWVPEGYVATLKELSLDDRFGPSYQLIYRKGQSSIGLQYATGGIGDRWFEEPARTVKVNHPFLGEITTALLQRQPPGRWTTNWVGVPGVMTTAGDRFCNGNLGLTFDKGVSEADIKRVIESLGAADPSKSAGQPGAGEYGQ